MVTVKNMSGIREGGMVFPDMLVARGCHLGGLRSWVVGSSSGTKSSDNDGLPFGPNAAMARANHISALGGHSNDITPLHNSSSHNKHREP